MTVSMANERPRFDKDLVRSMLEHADPLTLRGLVYHATGDADLEDIEVVEVQWPFSTARSVTNPDDLSLIRRKALGLLRAYHDGTLHPPSAAPTSRLLKAVSLALDEHVAPNAMRMHLDMLALNPAPRGWGEPPNAGNAGDYPVVVIGAGLAGVNAAVQLQASGIPFVLLDKNAGAGGTWFQNTYPGARVDWPSVLYSHSYGIDFKFQYAYAPQVHNEEYINWCIDQYGVRPHMRFGVAVESLTWNEEESVWLVLSRDVDGAEKLYRAAAVITAIGLLERPFIIEARACNGNTMGQKPPKTWLGMWHQTKKRKSFHGIAGATLISTIWTTPFLLLIQKFRPSMTPPSARNPKNQPGGMLPLATARSSRRSAMI